MILPGILKAAALYLLLLLTGFVLNALGHLDFAENGTGDHLPDA